MLEQTFEGKDGIKLYARSWRPDAAPSGVVVIVHGFKSHSGLYQWVGEQLVAQGLAVHALDQRGHGKSEGERYYVDKFTDYVADLDIFVGRVGAVEGNLPTYLLGHSAGGVVSCLYALDHGDKIDGLVCESFAHEVPAPDFALTVIKGLSHIAPHLHVLKLKDEDFSRDPAFVAQMKADPLVNHIAGPTQTLAEMVRADERLKAEFPKITTPVLILHGTEDKATKPSGSQHFYERAGSTDKTLKLYDGHFHDLLNDVGKEQVLADIIAWLNARIAKQ